jgi:hypothetical protein
MTMSKKYINNKIKTKIGHGKINIKCYSKKIIMTNSEEKIYK